jgi:ribosome biogenesis GTPase
MNNMYLESIPDRYQVFCKEYPSLSLCRVILQEKGLYRVISRMGTHLARISGKFQYEVKFVSDYPAVGDYIMADLKDADTAVVHTVLPRKSVFLRKAAGSGNTEQVVAANVDTVFLCMALNHDFNLRRLERYLSVAWDSGATPVVLLTKADLCHDLQKKLALVEGAAVGVDIITVSAMEDNGCQAITPYLIRGNTLAFVGSSGVGKSTLINALLGEERQKTNGLRSDDKGRHTTTHRELIILPGGVMVIDTPGMRELGMWDAGGGLSSAFADIEALAEGCRFRDCTHQIEPGCAIRAALERGELSEARLLSYRKLRAENSYFEDVEGFLAAKEKKFKKIAKLNKTNQKK